MLERDGPVPIYVQIAEMIQGQILRGELRAGEAVLSELAMEAEFGVARSTVRNVMRELRRRQLVHTVGGKGTFVGAVASTAGTVVAGSSGSEHLPGSGGADGDGNGDGDRASDTAGAG
ncbi:GntR family transcriptional regulator [Nonomuraea spiralis]|uniref:GntR family transcriptional regulator n=1 Tax=Nonomuraea spiralis TaxID=46182 RepID=UPI0037BB7128